MTQPRKTTTEATPAVTYLVWLVPGIPLVWGVWQTMIKVVQLFQ